MNISEIEFINSVKSGELESNLNKKESDFIDPKELKRLTSKRYGHTVESAKEHLLTDYSNGFTICGKCGSYYHFGNGFSKHLSKSCLICMPENRFTHMVNETKIKGIVKFPRRLMSTAFDDGLHYVVDKIEKYKFKDHV